MAERENTETELLNFLAECAHDPREFVMRAFPWGEKGSEVEQYDGPDVWQAQVLDEIGDALKTGVDPSVAISSAIQMAVASGHGVGKSSLVSWLILWGLSTFDDTKGVVTANTEVQLRTKTWPELAKWHRMFIARHWFHLTATAIYSADPDHEKTWRIDAVPWSERNTEAFAGLHNQGKRILAIFDEASAIPDIIWETTEGALTDEQTEIIWAAFGNPTRNTGRFRECFGRYKHRWLRHQIDSRTAKLTNKTQIEQWVADYGEDSDFVRVRVRGVFPRAGTSQFIPSDIVEMAASQAREDLVATGIHDPLVLGVDVSRYGDDETIFAPRRGRDAKTIPWKIFRGLDTMQIAARIQEFHNEHRFDAIFIDEGGLGAGVVDRCRYLRLPVTGINNGASPDFSVQNADGRVSYANKGAELWGSMRAWLAGGLIPNDLELHAQMIGREYGYVLREGVDSIMLEKKADMKKRGLSSPDRADGLALTFAYPVGPSDHTAALSKKPQHQYQYEPMQDAFRQGQANQSPQAPGPRNWYPGRGQY